MKFYAKFKTEVSTEGTWQCLCCANWKQPAMMRPHL